ncbi:MAG: PEGA domain-containing protein [Polyangiaceae bacterium]|nr:PEGA domain-containing protein [Polyangiaceae bacterium]
MIKHRTVLAALGLSLCLGFASSAHAGDKASAESLFQEGKRLMAEGKTAEACPKFEASQKADPSPGTLINLAGCYKALGKTASAWAEYKSAETLARNRGRDEQQNFAANAAAELEPHLSKLELVPPKPLVKDMTVTRDGELIAAGSLGTPVAVDPGKHEIKVSAPGYRPWTTTVEVGPDGDAQIVRIPALSALPPGETADGTVTPGDSGTGGPGILPWVLIGGGGVFMGTGLLFGVLAKNQASDAENDPTLCPNKECTAAGQDEIDSAEGKALISTIGVGVGAAAAITGVVLLLTSGSSSSAKTKRGQFATVTPVLGPRTNGVFLSGSF